MGNLSASSRVRVTMPAIGNFVPRRSEVVAEDRFGAELPGVHLLDGGLAPPRLARHFGLDEDHRPSLAVDPPDEVFSHDHRCPLLRDLDDQTGSGNGCRSGGDRAGGGGAVLLAGRRIGLRGFNHHTWWTCLCPIRRKRGCVDRGKSDRPGRGRLVCRWPAEEHEGEREEGKGHNCAAAINPLALVPRPVQRVRRASHVGFGTRDAAGTGCEGAAGIGVTFGAGSGAGALAASAGPAGGAGAFFGFSRPRSAAAASSAVWYRSSGLVAISFSIVWTSRGASPA